MKFNIKYILSLLLLVTATVSCDEMSLDVENPNEPDKERVLATPSDIENVASSFYNTLYVGMHSYEGVEMMLATAADNVSCSWGNQAMRDMSWEPRDFGWINTPSYSYRVTTKRYFDRMYDVIVGSSEVLEILNDGTIEVADAEPRIRAFCKFSQGVAYGNLGLVFDRSFIVDEETSVEPIVESAVDYKIVSASAIEYLEEAIAIASSNSFVIPSDWVGTEGDLSSAEFVKLINTYAARFLAYTPRNQTDLAAVDWNKVKNYADNGITTDFNVVNDGYSRWYAEAGDYLTFNGWGVTDMYVVHLMDPTQPQHWTDDPGFAHPPASTDPIDSRLETDFAYLNSNWFQAARGYYHYSNHRHMRYDGLYVAGIGPKPEIMKAENDMLRAEARVHLGEYGAAADIINTSTRKTRGEMEDVAAVEADLIQAIHHERHVEMYTTGMGLQFFEMRKYDLLQKGTPLHLPLPAETLQTFGIEMPYYTFGTEALADGVNTSNGGWR